MKELYNNGIFHLVQVGVNVGLRTTRPSHQPIGYVVKAIDEPVGSSWKYRNIDKALERWAIVSQNKFV